MKTTLKVRYRWIGAHGADYLTTGYAVIVTPGYTADGAKVELYATDKQFPAAADYYPVSSDLPQLFVDFLEPAGKRERDALVNAGYRLKDDSWYATYPDGAHEAARAYWAGRGA